MVVLFVGCFLLGGFGVGWILVFFFIFIIICMFSFIFINYKKDKFRVVVVGKY